MSSNQSEVSQSWVMYHMGLLSGQQSMLLEKVGVVIALHEKVRKGELDPATLNTHAGLEEFVELVKKFQNNASMLTAYALMWRRDWKAEHGEAPAAPPTEAKEKP